MIIMGRTTVSIIIIAGAAVGVVIIALTLPFFFATQGDTFYGSRLPANGSPSSLLLIQRIPIPNVNGRIDHMTVDITGRERLLFVAELENDSLDIIDLNIGKRVHSVDNDLSEPQGVLFIPEFDRIFVSNGQDGSVDIFDAKSFSLNKKIQLPSSDADNMRYDYRNGLIYVGYGQGAIGIINVTDGSIVGNIKLTAHPESFQIEEANKSSEGKNNRIFVNVPGSNSVVVVDKQKGTTLTTWSIPNAQNNFPMALDEGNHRLFVGTRDPAKLVVFDTDSGKVVSSLNIAQDPDDIFYDVAKKRLYISCGEGFVNIIQQQDANHYNLTGSIPTATGARTSLFVHELNRFYVAVPHQGGQESEIRVYKVG